MKKFVLLFSILFLSLSCKNTQECAITLELPSAPTESFDWLPGSWERINEQDGRRTFEIWDKSSGMEYNGFGYTLKNSDTIWQENINIVWRDTVWNFEVTGAGEAQPTIFRIKNIETKRFEAENQENEFPKLISYYRNGDKLHALISGGGNEIPFEFIPFKN